MGIVKTGPEILLPMGILGSEGVLVVVSLHLKTPHAILGWAQRSGGFLKALNASEGLIRSHAAIESPTKVLIVAYWKDMKTLMAWYGSQEHQRMVAWANSHSHDIDLTIGLFREEKGGFERMSSDDTGAPPRKLSAPS